MGAPHKVVIPEGVEESLAEFCDATPLAKIDLLTSSTVEDNERIGARFASEEESQQGKLILNETPRHRWVVSLHLQGFNHQEISDRTGYHRVTVGTILKQPWAQEFMDKVTNGSASQKVAILLNEAAAPAVERLIKEMDNPKARPAERVQAADKILDRLFGRAVQPIIHSQNIDPKKLSDAEIEKRLNELQSARNARS